MRKLLMACLILVTAMARAQTATAPPASDKLADPSKSAPGNGENPILKGAHLKTEWRNVRNPFRFEVNENKPVETDRFEQMHVVGYSKMPDENGILRTYAFVTKTSDGKDEKKAAKLAEAVKETFILQAFPGIISESTIPTEEQAETSSISLTSEQLWFLGVIANTNGQAVAIFWPYGSYPVTDDSLRQFEIRDRLKDLPNRVTKAGEKIGGSGHPLTVISKPKSKPIPVTQPPSQTATPPQPPQSPAPKPTINGSPDKAGETAPNEPTPTPTAAPATTPEQSAPLK